MNAAQAMRAFFCLGVCLLPAAASAHHVATYTKEASILKTDLHFTLPNGDKAEGTLEYSIAVTYSINQSGDTILVDTRKCHFDMASRYLRRDIHITLKNKSTYQTAHKEWKLPNTQSEILNGNCGDAIPNNIDRIYTGAFGNYQTWKNQYIEPDEQQSAQEIKLIGTATREQPVPDPR